MSIKTLTRTTMYRKFGASHCSLTYLLNIKEVAADVQRRELKNT